MTVVPIYQPSKANPAFVPEMYILTTLSTTSVNTITLGDLNTHVDTPSFYFTTNFLQLLDTLNLQ